MRTKKLQRFALGFNMTSQAVEFADPRGAEEVRDVGPAAQTR
jgi:hypothetical protein